MKSLAYYEQLFTLKSMLLPGGEKVVYREANPHAKKTIVVVHGITGTHYSMLQMAGPWAERGARVIMPDLPGHGGSDRIAVKRFNEIADWLHVVIKKFDIDGPFTLVGNSFGSAVCFSYICLNDLPDGSRVVLGAPTPTISLLSTRLEQASKLFPEWMLNHWYYRNRLVEWIRMKVLLADMKNDMLRDRLRESLRSEAKVVQHKYAMTLTGLMAHDRPFSQKLRSPEIQDHIYVVFGDKDKIAGPDVAEQMRAILPHAIMLRAKNCGHLVHIEATASLDVAVDI